MAVMNTPTFDDLKCSLVFETVNTHELNAILIKSQDVVFNCMGNTAITWLSRFTISVTSITLDDSLRDMSLKCGQRNVMGELVTLKTKNVYSLAVQ